MNVTDYSSLSMVELFRLEAETQKNLLVEGLLALERNPTAADRLESLMRAAHSLKGAGRLINLEPVVKVAHAMEDCFVAAQKGRIVLQSHSIDKLLIGVDMLSQIATTPESQMSLWEREKSEELESMTRDLTAITQGKYVAATSVASQFITKSPAIPDGTESAHPAPGPGSAETKPKETPEVAHPPEPVSKEKSAEPDITPTMPITAKPAESLAQDRVLRVTAENLNRLLGLAGESLVTSRWLAPFTSSLQRLKHQQWKLVKTVEKLRETLNSPNLDEHLQNQLAQAQELAHACLRNLSEHHGELESFGRLSANLSHRLYQEVRASRMRPFSDGVQGFARMVRDLGRSLGKEVKLEISGLATPVDRDILEKLEAPITHLLRNSVDHGIEAPAEREKTGKPREGTVILEARHNAGMLLISVGDDGRGISVETVRQAIVRKNLATAEMAEKMLEEELLEFLFLPGFTLRESVTEISGRGVGLDLVRTMVKEARGTVRITTTIGQGTRFNLHLALTLSVMRTLLVDIGGEAYAVPLARIVSAMRIPQQQLETIEGWQHFVFNGQSIGLVSARQILELPAPPPTEELWVIVLGERSSFYGLVVDRFLGERELVVQRLDPRLGKVKDIHAAALMADGTPVLIVDVDDLVRSIENLIAGGRLKKLQTTQGNQTGQQSKRVLVVDDSLTVRELERKLLGSRGYEVEVAVDGMDGWNAVRTRPYDLVISDVDMPRMDGIELVGLMKKDLRLKTVPIIIVSYKDRPEDRQRGLDAGADYYLTKGSFHDETLLQAVMDMIGEANG